MPTLAQRDEIGLISPRQREHPFNGNGNGNGNGNLLDGRGPQAGPPLRGVRAAPQVGPDAKGAVAEGGTIPLREPLDSSY